MQINSTVDKLWDILFPKFCYGCGREGYYLCEDCKAIMEVCEYDYCLCETNHQKTNKCPKCASKILSGLFFALPYKENRIAQKLIKQFKYPPHVKTLSETLAGLILEHFLMSEKDINKIFKDSVLIPVPLDIKKLKNRGYNQSEELAKELSKKLNTPVLQDYLIKIKSTEPQMSLDKKARENNLLGAFAIQKAGLVGANPAFTDIADKKIFLVDDVYTTGCTMNECALTLKRAGAKSVWGLCVAREG